jgi:hypothetical protein
MVIESDVNELVDKVEKVTKQREMDLSSDADLSIGIMNLISLEGHLFFTAEETHKDEYFDLLLEVRKMRIELLRRIIKEYEGEVWCISKHLLSASIRLMETGSKQLGKGKKEEAKLLFEKSYRLYQLFWQINSQTILSKEEKDISGKEIGKEKIEEGTLTQEETQGKEKVEGKAPTQEETQGKEKVVFVPVCQEPI